MRETEDALKNWRKHVTELRSQYDWLLFFSIPKILKLYDLLSTGNRRLDLLETIVCEISFLCPNNQPAREILKEAVQVNLLQTSMAIIRCICSIEVVMYQFKTLYSLKFTGGLLLIGVSAVRP